MEIEIIFFIALLLVFLYLNGRINSLEHQLGRLRDYVAALKGDGKPTDNHDHSIHHIPTTHSPSAHSPIHAAHDAPVKADNPLTPLIHWLKTDWMMKLGAFFVILALGWFVSYAFINNWVGPVGRIALGTISGALVYVVGYFFLKKKPVPGQVLIVLGATMILTTIVAARNVYGFFTPGLILALVGLVVFSTTVIAVYNNSLSMATLALIGGAAAPLIANGLTDHYLMVTVYALIISGGALVISSLKGWRSLLLLALAIMFIYTGSFYKLPDRQVYLFMALFYAIFLIGGAFAVISTKIVKFSDVITTFLIVLIAIFWITEYVPNNLHSIILAATTIFSLIISLISQKLGAPRIVTYVHAASAIVLLGTATFLEFSNQALVIILSLEVLAVVLASAFALRDSKATLVVSALHFIPTTLALDSALYWDSALVLNRDFFVLLIVGLSLALTGLILNTLQHPEKLTVEAKNVARVAYAAATVFFMAIIWRVLETVIDSPSYAHGVALVIYTIIALSAFYAGVRKDDNLWKVVGIVFFSLVALRLLFVEVWIMSLIGRVITFVVIGVLFIITAFFQKKIAPTPPHSQ